MRQLLTCLVLTVVCALATYASTASAQRACDENTCYDSLAAAEAAMREKHPAGTYFRRTTSYISSTSPTVRSTIVYAIPDQPPASLGPPGYYLGGHGVTETGCQPHVAGSNGCADEQALLANHWAYIQSRYPECTFRNGRITGSYAEPFQEAHGHYTGSSGNPGSIYFNKPGRVKKWEWEMNCPGSGDPSFTSYSLEFQKFVYFQCPAGLYARTGYAPGYAPAHANESSIIESPYFCRSSETWRITVDGVYEQSPPINGLGPCEDNCDVMGGG